jgi:acyl carrier protein phosphodiesterase
MNHLAHFCLADHSAVGWMGSFLGEYVKGGLKGRLPDGIERGILLHRKIDSYTDCHPMAAASRNRISPARRRFAGIIIDVGYDHFLSKNWSKFCMMDLADFTARVYEALLPLEYLLPEQPRRALPRMVRENWLMQWRSLAGVAKTLDRISARINRRDTLPGAIEEIQENYDSLEADFLSFFPDLMQYVVRTRGLLHSAH